MISASSIQRTRRAPHQATGSFGRTSRASVPWRSCSSFCSMRASRIWGADSSASTCSLSSRGSSLLDSFSRKVLDRKNEPAVLLRSAVPQDPPAATLVIIATVLASYHWLGYLRGDQTAVDGRTASLFFASLHFASIGTNYLGAQQPPSPLQNFWSLSVEEQFYLVYPTIFLLLAAFGRRLTLRVKLTGALAGIVAASFVWSVVQTSSNATSAYFSPFTRCVGVGPWWSRRRRRPLHRSSSSSDCRTCFMVRPWCNCACDPSLRIPPPPIPAQPWHCRCSAVQQLSLLVLPHRSGASSGSSDDVRCSGSASCPIRCICGTGRFS